MKNKLLLCAMTVVAFAFTSCKQKTDFYGICDDVSGKTLKGYFSGAAQSKNGKAIEIVQFQFMDDGSVERTVMEEGDGIYKAPTSRKFTSYSLGEYFNQQQGRYIALNPADGGEPLTLKFYDGGLAEENQPFAPDKNNKVSDIASTDTAVVGFKWYGNDTAYYKIDTVVNVLKLDSIYRRTGYKRDDEGNIMRDSLGKPIWEQVLDHVDSTITPTKMKWPVAPNTVNIKRLELYRDPVTFVNTGKWYMLSQVFTMDKNRVATLKVDTVSAYDFHWNFVEYTSSSAFVVNAVQESGASQLFTIQYDFRLPAITVEQQVLKIEE